MDFKETKVQELVQVYNIPAEAAALCVDNLGGVSQEKLAVAFHTVQALKDGLTAKTRAEVEVLKTHLKDCHDQAKLPGADRQTLAMQCISIKRRIYEMGGRP
jgi:hypothetical protein